ncbi:MAG: terminase small subunit [Nitrospiria bacterium]
MSKSIKAPGVELSENIIDEKEKKSDFNENLVLSENVENNALPFKNEKEFNKFLQTFKKEHKVFCDNYLMNLNLTESYKIAYPEASDKGASQSASRLLSSVNSQRYISYIYAKRQKKLEISENKLLSNLNDLYNRAMQAVPVLDKHGKETGKYNFQGMAAAKAAELIAKITGIGLTNKRINSDNLVIVKTYVVPQFRNTISIPEQSPEDIKKLIEEYANERK